MTDTAPEPDSIIPEDSGADDDGALMDTASSPPPLAPALQPTFVRGTARGGGFVLRPTGTGVVVRGSAEGAGLRLRPATRPP